MYKIKSLYNFYITNYQIKLYWLNKIDRLKEVEITVASISIMEQIYNGTNKKNIYYLGNKLKKWKVVSKLVITFSQFIKTNSTSFF